MRRSCWIAAWAAIAYQVAGSAGRAEAAPQIAVVSTGSCPARSAVLAALAQAMPGVVIVGDTEGPGGAEPVVVMSDDSASYHTVVRGIVRTLVDAPGNCEERARKVAIIAALAFDPGVDPRSHPPQCVSHAPDAVAPRAAAATAVPESGTGMRLEFGLLREYGWIGATRDAPRHLLLTLGSTARLTIERGAIGLVIGGSLTAPSDVRDMKVQRIPIDVAVQLRRRERWIAGAVALGPSLVVQRVERGHEFSSNLELDLRLSGRLELWLARNAAAYAAITGTYIPYPTPVGEGDIERSSMPTWWFAISAGLVLQIR